MLVSKTSTLVWFLLIVKARTPMIQMRIEAEIEPVTFRGKFYRLAQKVDQLIAGNADVPSALSAKREKPLIVFETGITFIRPDADETSAFPAFTGFLHPGSTF
jgi:hypothetical protein